MSPTITVGSFFRRVRSTLLFICSTTSNLNNFKPQQLQPQKRVQNEKKKNKTDVQNLENTLRIPHSPTFFRHYEIFLIAPKGPPSFVSIFCNTMDVKKLQRVPPFTFFGTVTLFKNLIKKFSWEIFSCPQRVPLQFFFIFCNQLEFHKARRVPPFQFWALDMAPTLAVLGLFSCSVIVKGADIS